VIHFAAKDENKRVSTEEQQKRQELSTKFHNTIKDITSKLEEQGDERLQQIKENEILREKLKHFTQQYEIREQHYGHQVFVDVCFPSVICCRYGYLVWR
jgi:hypothetical protein